MGLVEPSPSAGNYSTFELNVMHALRGCTDCEQVLEEADAMFLRGVHRDPFAAERAAVDWAEIGETIAALTLLGAANTLHFKPEFGAAAAQSTPELYSYLRERAYRRHLPGD